MHFIKGLLVVFAVTVGAGQPGHADGLVWNFSNETEDTVSLEFFSQDRDQVWPGDGEVYLLDPAEAPRTYALPCDLGEMICYGAWTRADQSTQWGKGHAGQDACQDCCSICGGGQPEPVTLSQ